MLSAPALLALDLLVSAAFFGGADPQVTDSVFDELDLAGELDALAQLEEEPALDWAAPDEIDTALELHYDTAADPYDRGESFEQDERAEFMLGTDKPTWLWPRRINKNGTINARGRDAKPAGTLFVSFMALGRRKSAFPKGDTPFCLDSGGFTQIKDHGRFIHSPEVYAAAVVRLQEETGSMGWAATQDWMCETKMLEKTGLTIEEHQRRSVASYLRLRELAPTVRWLPTLQGQTVADYLAHAAMYEAAGVDLKAHERVGVGSVCRRQSEKDIADLFAGLAVLNCRWHAFGMKTQGLRRVSPLVASSDSLAWSDAARHQGLDQHSQVLAEEFRTKLEAIVAENPARASV